MNLSVNLYNAVSRKERRLYIWLRTMIANYILEGVYFYSGFMFFYNLGRIGKMPGSVQEIRYINRDENTHLVAVSLYYFGIEKRGTGFIYEMN